MEPEDIETTDFPTSWRGYDPESVKEYLSYVATEFRQALRSASSQPSPPPAPPPPPSPRGYADQLGQEVASIVEFATLAANELRSNAEREADAIRSAAAEEVAEMTQVAMRQLELAHEAKAEAERESDAIRAAARYDANRIEQEARSNAALVQREAVEKAAQLERATNNNVAAVLVEARKRYEQVRTAQERSVERLASVKSIVIRAIQEASEEEVVPGTQDFLDARGDGERAKRTPTDGDEAATETQSRSRTSGNRAGSQPNRLRSDRRAGSRPAETST